jgi:hypothetical protein
MIANSAFFAAMSVMLLAFWLLGQLDFLVPYKRLVFGRHLWLIVSAAVLIFLNVFALSYALARGLFLKDTGRKLAHVDRQQTPWLAICPSDWQGRSEPMSRGSRDDVRAEPTRDDPNRAEAGLRSTPDPYLPGRDLKLPRTDVREPIQAGGKVYHLRGSESRALATVGAFRVIPANDLEEQRTARDVWHGDVQRLADQGLIERTRVSIGGRPTAVLVLTREGKACRGASGRPRDGRRQRSRRPGQNANFRMMPSSIVSIRRKPLGLKRTAGRSRVVLDYG